MVIKIIALLFALMASPLLADIQVTDDAGNRLILDRPAQRIISLAPHTTELLFAAGAGEKLVGAAEYSDYPEQARTLRRIGGVNGIDLESVITLKPDLVVGWQSGNRSADISRLKSLGLTVFLSEPDKIEDIASSIERLGKLTGTESKAAISSAQFRKRLHELRIRYRSRKKVKIFYQIWHKPLMTVNADHMISKIISGCGGVNIYSDMEMLTPTVSLEDVINRNPGVILYGGEKENTHQQYEIWGKWQRVTAVKNNHIFNIPSDLLHRHTPRILEGMERVCKYLDLSR